MRVLLFVLLIGLSNTFFAQSNFKNRSANKISDIPPGYYSGTENLTGEELKSALHAIIRNHIRRSYSQVREDLKTTDEDPNNSSNVLLLYTGWSSPKSNFGGGVDNWNREHVWPKSHGFPNEGDTAYTDIHHLRPTDVTVNSARGNLDFDNGGIEVPEAPGNYFDGDSWEPRDAVKGDVARMVFYMSTRYEQTGNYDLELTNFAGTTGPFLGVDSTLIEWHNGDPVDTFEINRHEKIYAIQGNRNPFVDHPEFVAKIWGDTSSTPDPTADSTFYISEVSDALATGNEFLEIFNNSDQVVDLTGAKLIRLNGNGTFDGYVFDFASDGSGDTQIQPYGFLITARGSSKAAFEGEWGVLPTGVAYFQGNDNLYFGSGTARRWAMKTGGTANTNDGTLIDDTQTAVAGSGKRSYQNVVGGWITENSIANSTPGELDAGQALPVELTSFSVQTVNGYALITWQTASEQNNLGFEIQRSVGMKNNWGNIGFVPGKGTSNAANYYSFTDDKNLLSGNYSYRLKQIDLDGSYTFSDVLQLNITEPDETVLYQNSPNPFNPSTNIEFKVQSAQNVILDVYDIKGERIITLVNKYLQPGSYKFNFDAGNLSSGIYFYRLQSDKTIIKKMNFLK
ncbi:MAG: T9SS type A sorting domain-containing protein [Ignavibacteriae bacterium]|nr:T9SS C-terminal target domain-containing protein [Ignavibacteriota bacterium]NOG96975.1 T9SS type A sorting domain-containing protein [Ignavibacteriota bacterium]